MAAASEVSGVISGTRVDAEKSLECWAFAVNLLGHMTDCCYPLQRAADVYPHMPQGLKVCLKSDAQNGWN